MGFGTYDYAAREKRQAECQHERILEDKFSKLPGVRRCEPGDVCCVDCGLPLPIAWNNGKPKPIEINA